MKRHLDNTNIFISSGQLASVAQSLQVVISNCFKAIYHLLLVHVSLVCWRVLSCCWQIWKRCASCWGSNSRYWSERSAIAQWRPSWRKCPRRSTWPRSVGKLAASACFFSHQFHQCDRVTHLLDFQRAHTHAHVLNSALKDKGPLLPPRLLPWMSTLICLPALWKPLHYR